MLLVVAGLMLPASGALAATLPPSFTPSCPTENPDGESYGGVRICSGSVPSFDGSKMDVDLTQPMPGARPRHPLIVMLHGFGNDKHEWESTTDEGDGADKYHWNNHWFAQARLLRPQLHGARVLGRRAERGPSAAHARRSQRLHQPSARHAPPQEPRLRDPRHPVARGPGGGDVPGRRPGPGRRDRRLIRRHRELAPGEPAHLDVPALARRVAADPRTSRSRCRSTRPPTSPTRSPPTGTAAAPRWTTCTSPRRVARTTTMATATRSASRRRAT